MPRQARLDGEGALHHVLVRGNNKSDIFLDDRDKAAFVSKLGENLAGNSCAVYAWALMNNHIHLLFKSGSTGISDFMRRQLTWYAGYFNRKYQRTGHLFENRFKSILCEEERYFLALIRYINLNPLRAGLVQSVVELETYPWCSHSVFMGNVHHNWMETDYALSRFGSDLREARSNYRQFIQEGISLKEEPEIKSFEETSKLIERPDEMNSQAKKAIAGGDTRILGSAEFIRQVYCENELSVTADTALRVSSRTITQIIEEQSRNLGISVKLICSGNRRYDASRARTIIAQNCIDELGLSYAAIARELGVTTSAIRKAVIKLK